MQQQYKLDQIFYFLSLIMVFLISMLFFEWSQIRIYSQELVELKQDYQAYIQLLRRKIPETNDDNCIETPYESIFVNRDFTYLRDSAIGFLKEEYLLADFYLDTTNKENQKDQFSTQNASATIIQNKYKKTEWRQNRSLFSWPVERGLFWLSSPFGPRKRADGSPGFHQGIDLAAVKGTKVQSAAAGIVLEAGFSRGYGNTILIMHNKKYKTRYAHLDKIIIRRNQKVDRNQVIGTVGDTGLVRSESGDGSHLHFEVYVFGKKVNPRKFLP